MKLNTISTIELSSKCNLACSYCINRLMPKYGRKQEIMSDRVFNESILLLEILVNRGTQKEVNVNGNGESCLDPDLIKRVRVIRSIIGESRLLQFSTNGINFTRDMASGLMDAGINTIWLSPHRPEYTRKAIEILHQLNLPVNINPGAMTSPHNWADQLEPENRVTNRLKLVCQPIREGWGYIQSHGGISPCCFDFRGLGQFGTVFDKGILDIEIKPYILCKTCYQEL